MPKNTTSEKFWELYDKLPRELKDALFAEETGDSIYDVCQKNNLWDKSDDIVKSAGQVLLGVLTPEDFKRFLEGDLKLKADIAKNVFQDLNRTIFYPVKPILDKMHGVDLKAEKIPTIKDSGAVVSSEIKTGPKEEVKSPPGRDSYREEVE